MATAKECKKSTSSWLASLKNAFASVPLLVNLRNRTGEERRRQTLCDKRDNNFALLPQNFTFLWTNLFVEVQETSMLSEFPTKHASNIPVTFVTLKRFAVLFFLPSCCVNSLSLPLPLSTLLIHSTVLKRKNCALIRDCVSTFWRHYLRKYGKPSLSQAKLEFNLKPLLLHDNYLLYCHELYVWINCIFKRNYYD